MIRHCDRCYLSVVCLSVCHVHALFSIGRRYRRFLLRTTAPCFSQITANIWLTLFGQPFLPKFCPKVTTPAVKLSVGDIRSQIAAEWLQIAQRSQWRAYRKLPSLFLMVPSLTPYDLPFPPKWGFHMPQHTLMAISLQRVIRSTSCLVLE